MRCSSPGAPIPSDETAQALKDRLRGATPDWPAGTGWEGKHNMCLSSQAPDGRKASPLAGFPRKDLQILAGSTRGKAPQAGGEAAGDIRTGRVLGGRLCRDKGSEDLCQRSDDQISLLPQLSELWLLLLSIVSPGSLLSLVSQQVPGDRCHFHCYSLG